MKRIKGVGKLVDIIPIVVVSNNNSITFIIEPFFTNKIIINNDWIPITQKNYDSIFKYHNFPLFHIKRINSINDDVVFKIDAFIKNNIYTFRYLCENVNMHIVNNRDKLFDYKQIGDYFYQIPKDISVYYECMNDEDKNKYAKIWLWFEFLHDTRPQIIHNMVKACEEIKIEI